MKLVSERPVVFIGSIHSVHSVHSIHSIHSVLGKLNEVKVYIISAIPRAYNLLKYTVTAPKQN